MRPPRRYCQPGRAEQVEALIAGIGKVFPTPDLSMFCRKSLSWKDRRSGRSRVPWAQSDQRGCGMAGRRGHACQDRRHGAAQLSRSSRRGQPGHHPGRPVRYHPWHPRCRPVHQLSPRCGPCAHGKPEPAPQVQRLVEGLRASPVPVLLSCGHLYCSHARQRCEAVLCGETNGR